MSKLPKPTAKFRASIKEEDRGSFTEQEIRGVICNPIFTGIGPIPRMVTDEEWVIAATRIIKQEGLEQFLVNLLYMLRETFRDETESSKEKPMTLLEFSMACKDSIEILKSVGGMTEDWIIKNSRRELEMLRERMKKINSADVIEAAFSLWNEWVDEDGMLGDLSSQRFRAAAYLVSIGKLQLPN